MLDENMQDFQRRIARVNGAHASARGAGAGMRLGPFGLRTLILILAAVFAVKAAMLLRLGSEEYEARLATLRAGEPLGQIGAALLHIDPVTVQMAAGMRWIAR